MKIYCMSDIHGCLAEFEKALSFVLEHLDEEDTKLILLGDYVHGGPDNRGVLDRIISLQNKYGRDKVIALLGNHEKWILECISTIDHMIYNVHDLKENDEKYYRWFESLPKYHVEGNTIFVHAGINENAGAKWERKTRDNTFLMKYPAVTGKIKNLSMKVVAGHVGTAEIAEDPQFHDIYYDGGSHYSIDGSVRRSGIIPVLMVDTETDSYYRVTETGSWPVLPYKGDN